MILNTPISREEMETHILIDGSGEVVIDTSMQKVIRKCTSLGYEILNADYYDGKIVAAIFKAPEKCVSLRKPSGGLSEEQRKRLSERMKEMAANRKEALYE